MIIKLKAADGRLLNFEHHDLGKWLIDTSAGTGSGADYFAWVDQLICRAEGIELICKVPDKAIRESADMTSIRLISLGAFLKKNGYELVLPI